MGKYTSSTRLITEKTLELFEHILDKRLLTRRLTITANHLLTEEQAKAVAPGEQLTIFDVPQTIAKKDAEEELEMRKQKTLISIKKRFGPNAIMKGTSYQDAATGIERNKSIGGHHE